MEKPNGQICNAFESLSNKNRRTKIRSFSVFGPNSPPKKPEYSTILQYTNTLDLHPSMVSLLWTHRQAKERICQRRLPFELNIENKTTTFKKSEFRF